MGERVQTDQETDQGDLGVERADSPDPRQNKPGRRPQPKPDEGDAVEFQQGILRHYFPGFLDWLRKIRDPRKAPEACTFPIEYLMMLSLMMLCGQSGSRRQLGRQLSGKRMGGNIWRLVGKAYSHVVCHPDTMNNVMEILDPGEIENLIGEIFNALRRCRALDRFRFEGLLIVAIDATGILSFEKLHCEHCTYQTSNGVTTYFHNVLAAKVVTPIGLIIPLAFEFIENPEGEYDKQDCELKSWRRLFTKIRTRFPKLKINLVADGLYAEETSFRNSEKANWNFIITLSDDKLPTVTRQLPKSRKGWTGNRTTWVTTDDNKRRKQTVRWKTPLRYHGDIVHVVELEETNEEGVRTYYNRWITNVKPDKHNALDLAQTGRLRWKIENEGTNTQKNSGYEMEHAFGLKHNAWKNYYLMLQIAQLINDLVRFSDFIQKSTGDPRATFGTIFETIQNFAQKLIESLRNGLPSIDPLFGRRIQIRFLRT